MKALSFESGTHPYHLSANVILAGPDISLCILGGTHPHIGASALGIPRNSLQNEEEVSASVSVLTAVGHKEDIVAHDAAHHLAATFNCRVCVQAGIHIDNATPEEIQTLMSNYNNLMTKITTSLISLHDEERRDP